MKRQIVLLLKKTMKNRGRISRGIDTISVGLHKIYENLDYEFRTNGEFAVLKKVANVSGSINTVFDVGANKGDWSITASELFPQADIHSFEIVPQTFDGLVKNCEHRENIACHNIGLSDTEGTSTVFFSPDHSGLATCVPGFVEKFHKFQPHNVETRVISGDMFCADKGINEIDFLKIDVEGFEHKVLKGFEGMLERGKIKIIQFEYGYINIDTHFLLKDFYDYLGKFDMRTGKIYSSYVDLRDYRHRDENFYGPNYLAVHSSCKVVADALGRR